MKELNIVKYIREYGLERAIKDFKLDFMDYPHKVLLKYNSIESDFNLKEVLECRGLILEKETWNVLSYPFDKFFNQFESKAANVDWKTAKVFEKMDGTMIHSYYDPGLKKMMFGTIGSAEGENAAGKFHNSESGLAFFELFCKAFLETAFSALEPDEEFVRSFFESYRGLTLVFELCTPENVVVTPHENYRVYLLGGRDLSSLKEISHEELVAISREINVPIPRNNKFKNEEDVKLAVSVMPFFEEGFVVCDENHNRIKIKNPKYLDAQYFIKSVSSWKVMNIIRSGGDDLEEYKVVFPTRLDEILHLKKEYDEFMSRLKKYTEEISEFDEFKKFKEAFDSSTKTNPFRKDFAFKVFEWARNKGLSKHTGFFMAWADGKQDPKKYLDEFDGRELYDILISNFK